VAAKSVAAQAVKDAYAAVKALLRRKYASIDLAAIEAKPASESKRSSLAEDLQEVKAASDAELITHIQALVKALEQHPTSEHEAKVIGIDLEKIKFGSLHVGDVSAEGIGLRMREAEIPGAVTIDKVTAATKPAHGESTHP
jgi:hypothetical protein